jgi:hypothetical protein
VSREIARLVAPLSVLVVLLDLILDHLGHLLVVVPAGRLSRVYRILELTHGHAIPNPYCGP